MKRFFLILFWIFATCVILVADYNDEPYYALFGTLMLASGLGYIHEQRISNFFKDND